VYLAAFENFILNLIHLNKQFGLTGDLRYEYQITTLSKVRNCLVHRNSIVTIKDINDKTNNLLRAQYSRMKMYTEKDGQETEL